MTDGLQDSKLYGTLLVEGPGWRLVTATYNDGVHVDLVMPRDNDWPKTGKIVGSVPVSQVFDPSTLIRDLCAERDHWKHECEQLEQRRDELLKLVADLSRNAISADEADELHGQIRALIARIGTLRAPHRVRDLTAESLPDNLTLFEWLHWFHGQCSDIVMGLIEGASRDETADALLTFALKHLWQRKEHKQT